MYQILDSLKNIPLQDILSLLNVLILFIGFLFGIYQWAHANKLKRAEFLKQIIEKLYFDEQLSRFMYDKIEYNNDIWYTNDFHGGPNEDLTDKFLLNINYICYLRDLKIIKQTNLRF